MNTNIRIADVYLFFYEILMSTNIRIADGELLFCNPPPVICEIRMSTNIRIAEGDLLLCEIRKSTKIIIITALYIHFSPHPDPLSSRRGAGEKIISENYF
jgi:hypothetical protein